MKKILVILSVAVIIWAAASWVEVASHNDTPNYQYSNLNLYQLLIK